MKMPVSQGGGGRRAQKARTRAAIVEAAHQLAAAGSMPRVEEAADAAGVSRATAYRYFPSQEALAVELAIRDVWRDLEAMLARLRTRDVARRLDALIEAMAATVGQNESHVRTVMRVFQDTALRGNLEADAPLRRARRTEWIEVALAPAPSLPSRASQQLRRSLALIVSPDAVIQLKDALGLTIEEAGATLKWSARAVLAAALAEADAEMGAEEKRGKQAR
jgi:AcrR family transcriptional regulator